jgi:hypothetical protein
MMENPETTHATKHRERMHASRSVGRLFLLTYLTGLLLPAALGIVIRSVLAAKGVSVATWSEGAGWVMPLTLMFLIPFALLAHYSRSVLRRVRRRGMARFRKWLYIFVAAYLGTTLGLGVLLVDVLQSIEGIAHVVAFWPFTLPYLLLWGIGSAVVAGPAGWLVWAVWSRRMPEHRPDPPPPG